MGNSTCEAAEAAINQLEGGAGSVVYGSGMAAISAALMTFLKSGDHVVRSTYVLQLICLKTTSFIAKMAASYLA